MARAGRWSARDRATAARGRARRRPGRPTWQEREVVEAREQRVSEQPRQRDRQHAGSPKPREPLRAPRRRHEIRRKREERAKEACLGEAVQNADRVDHGADRVDPQVERTGEHIEDATGEDHPPAPAPIHDATDRRARRDRGERGEPEEEADLHFVRTELREIARKVQEQVERETLREVRDRAQHEHARDESRRGHAGESSREPRPGR